MSRLLARLACVAVLSVPALSAHAEIVIGVDVSTTGAAAAIGIQTNNAVRLWPATLGGQPARYVVLDDGTDVSRAVKNMRKLTSEDKVDAIVGPNITAAALAGLDAGRDRHADDRAGGLQRDCRAAVRSQARLGLQDAAERLADGHRHGPGHEEEGPEERGLHRLRRFLWRQLVEGIQRRRRPT